AFILSSPTFGKDADELQRFFDCELIKISEREQVPASVAYFEQKRLGLKPASMTIRARGVGAISREHYPDVHFVGSGFKPAKVASNTIPDTGPFMCLVLAVIRVAINDPLLRL